MSIAKEFKEFVMRGNVVDMAVGIVIGAAFGKIVTSLVNDVIMLPLGAVLGGIDFSDWALKTTSGDKEVVVLRYGAFLTAVLDFLIVAAAIFVVVKLMNMLRHQPPAAPPPPPKQEVLLTEIRDLLKARA
ncbi:MAG TPA: large-conductance mechanosensitive channel protein MscL [Pirellulales bacterium]|jgi:large conductance mechanosensitive channel|nr:large-conductance mechanosensitive channel protein MscL [Pirellulales bacterium]